MEHVPRDVQDSSFEAEVEARCSNVEASNPVLDEQGAEKLKGDAIGNTLYSESGLLKTLISLSKFNDDAWSEQFEEQLCFLWDMTFEDDVIAVLLQHDFINLACQVIQTSSVPRLIEILIGILGNMSARKEVRIHLAHSSTADILISLLATSDSLTLLQLVRLLNSCVWHVNRSSHTNDGELQDEEKHLDLHAEVESWIALLKNNSGALNEHLSFILKSSTNEELLQSTLELLNNLCCTTSKNHYFSEFLSTSMLLEGLTEALHQLLDVGEEKEANVVWGDKSEKAAQHWTQTLSAFTLHHAGTDLIYDQRQIIMRSLCSILDPLGLQENIFPLDSRKLEILDSILDVIDCLKNKKNYSPPALLPRILTILSFLSVVTKDTGDQADTPEESDNEESLEMQWEVQSRLFTYCFSVLCDIDLTEFLEAFGDNPIPKVRALLSSLSQCSDHKIVKITTVIERLLT
ncbi:uncharacterized protein LOC117641823 [Thrips palmi]|uniref:Uncharacterized protein LOC117641823 n=1 Tax=Thrips palmi TaxID=161013 RepID=A0A6P8ZJH7_THRPL|nr:uncharacterized protein LOC117641823 [Thrips palmi]